MYHRRQELRDERVLTARKLKTARDKDYVRTDGPIIARQRTGTAKGFIVRV
jgi:error-prone DNA polymerase